MLVKKDSESMGFDDGVLRIVGVRDVKITDRSTVKPHLHVDVEEIYYILEGSGMMMVGDKDRKVARGDLIYVPPRQIHTISHTGRKPLRFITLSICVCREPEGRDHLHYIG